MTRRKNNYRTREELERPIPFTCGTCGGPATLYCQPRPHGSCVCDTCTPAWFKAFVIYLVEKYGIKEIPE